MTDDSPAGADLPGVAHTAPTDHPHFPIFVLAIISQAAWNCAEKLDAIAPPVTKL